MPEASPHSAPISLSFWASAEISFAPSIALLAEFIEQRREMLTRSLYLQIQNPRERFAFGWGLAFARAASKFNAARPDWMLVAHPYGLMPATLDLPGFFPHLVSFTYGCAQYAMAYALDSQAAAISAMIKGFSADARAEILQALRLAAAIVEQDGCEPPSFQVAFQGIDAAAFQACLASLDQSARDYLQEQDLAFGQRMLALGRQRASVIARALDTLDEADAIRWQYAGPQIKQACRLLRTAAENLANPQWRPRRPSKKTRAIRAIKKGAR